jgi:bifunctional non-homologous end joining protein LigD
LIDGEAIVCDGSGLAVFELIRRHGTIASAVHCVFDLLEFDGRDLRREPIEKRKDLLAELLGSHRGGNGLNTHRQVGMSALPPAAAVGRRARPVLGV